MRAARCTPVLAIGSILAAVTVLAAGCGGGSSKSTSSAYAPSAPAPGRQLAFSRCMRSHGVLNFPDPTSDGAIPKVALQQLGVSSSQFETAQTVCLHLLPNGGQPTRAALQRSWNDFRAFARCMRSHGVPTWPDPTRYPQHPERPTFDLQAAGIDANSSQITPKIHECEPLLRGNNPQHLGE